MKDKYILLGMAFIVPTIVGTLSYKYSPPELHHPQKEILLITADNLEKRMMHDDPKKILRYADENLVSIIFHNNMDLYLRSGMQTGKDEISALRRKIASLESQDLDKKDYREEFHYLAEDFLELRDQYEQVIPFSGINRQWTIGATLASLIFSIASICYGVYKEK